MPPPRLLVIEGNTAASRAEQVAAGGIAAGEGYATLLRELWPEASADICFPADAEVVLTDGSSLDSYDGAVVTGSALHVYNGGTAVERQIALVRAIFAAGVPLFGSCWGLQVITAAAGGTVHVNPKGREAVYGRDIRVNQEGRGHPMFAGKAEVFDAMTFHLDEVATVAPGTTLLASNATTRVQAVEIRAGKATAWAVQYHPEYPFCEVAAIVRRTGTRLVDEGFCPDRAALKRFIGELDALGENPADKTLAARHHIGASVLDKRVRTREIANWIAYRVRPHRARRGRG